MKASRTMAAYWLATIRRYACGATLEGCCEDDILRAALEGIQEGRAVTTRVTA